ncbi:aminoglycoside 6'-N-acetyltransferase [Nocardia mangyaensis]|uniref:aminoglycoside 6'-N-acetyltransferase n=1 Tax=Nocardia mangyaensis TaxID=2213200 RepID=UPI002675EA0B|nr:aminoglycoside 6'-N-acetyltransferase [Nocardia mangyaensis]MDO3645479.1 GNAT family N-acetyltransferase [Nocardia mangyaensis]
MRIHPCGADDLDELASLRVHLWPEGTVDEHRADVGEQYDGSGSAAAYLARDDRGVAVGFGEIAVRHDYVNGCDTSPVAFLEGLFVVPAHRRSGVARALCEALEAWGRDQGCTELGSDALLSNVAGQRMHAALGFAERERVVYYRKML